MHACIMALTNGLMEAEIKEGPESQEMNQGQRPLDLFKTVEDESSVGSWRTDIFDPEETAVDKMADHSYAQPVATKPDEGSIELGADDKPILTITRLIGNYAAGSPEHSPMATCMTMTTISSELERIVAARACIENLVTMAVHSSNYTDGLDSQIWSAQERIDDEESRHSIQSIHIISDGEEERLQNAQTENLQTEGHHGATSEPIDDHRHQALDMDVDIIVLDESDGEIKADDDDDDDDVIIEEVVRAKPVEVITLDDDDSSHQCAAEIEKEEGLNDPGQVEVQPSQLDNGAPVDYDMILKMEDEELEKKYFATDIDQVNGEQSVDTINCLVSSTRGLEAKASAKHSGILALRTVKSKSPKKRKKILVTQPIKKPKGIVRNRLAKQITNQAAYQLPMELGWKREVVIRSGSTLRVADVYYYPPIGKKLRSIVEVANYLNLNNIDNLTSDNFSYALQRVNSPNEMIRKSAPKRKYNPSQPAVSQSLSIKNNCALKNLVMSFCNTTPTMAKDAGSANAKKKNYLEKVNPSASVKSEDDIEMRSFPVTASEDSDKEPASMAHWCTHLCPGQEGCTPSLRCNKCFCLFHPNCVGISNMFATSTNFTCQGCGGGEVDLRRQIESSRVSPNETANWSVNNVTTMKDVDRNSVFPFKGYSANVSATTVTQCPAPANNVPVFGNERLSASGFDNVKHFPCGLTIEKVSPRTSAASGCDGATSELTPASISVIPLAPSPATLCNKINDNLRAILNKPIPPLPPTGTPNNAQRLRPVLIPLSGSAFPLLKNAIMKYTTPVRPQGSARRGRGGLNRNNVPPAFSQLLPNPCVPDIQLPANSTPRHSSTLVKAEQHCSKKPKANALVPTNRSIVKPHFLNHVVGNRAKGTDKGIMNLLNFGVQSLIAVFKYLTMSDILRASEVCRTWRILSKIPEVWETVVLKDIRVNDWDVFVRNAICLSTQNLDVREMVVDGTDMPAFEGFLNSLNALTDLRSLTLGESSPAVAYAAMTRLPNLDHFSAEWISPTAETNSDQLEHCCTVDIDKFALTSKLQSLRLRGVNGLDLTKVHRGFERLRHLNSLTCLAITSMKDLPSGEFEFLDELRNLTTLEMGECVNWTENIYTKISRMKKLRTLRLEFGGQFGERGIQIILPTLTELVLLELIIFRIPSNFGDLLSRLKKLQQLTVWPDLKCVPERNNFYAVKATKQITFVKILMWGLVTSHLRDPVLDQPGEIDHNSCCVPFLNYEPVCSTILPLACRTRISAHQLMNKLRAEMPHSKVQVIMVPNELYSTICYMPRHA